MRFLHILPSLILLPFNDSLVLKGRSPSLAQRQGEQRVGRCPHFSALPWGRGWSWWEGLPAGGRSFLLVGGASCRGAKAVVVPLLSCPTLCDPRKCSMPRFSVPHHFPEFAPGHCISDAIPPSCLLLLPSPPPALNLSQHQGLFPQVSSLHKVSRVLEFLHQSLQ